MTDKLMIEVKKTLLTIKEDAQMAINGDWDIRGDGMPLNRDAEKAFEDQIDLIDKVLNKLS